jgi:glycosyltransferase involved in cell wall biosynthesis
VKVTVVIPTLNEEAGIGPTIDELDRAAFEEAGWDLEVLVIDGDSKDGTAEEAKARGARVIVDTRKGYGRAYKTGFAQSRGDIIVTGDADGTYPFNQAHKYVQHLLDSKLDFVTCNRYGQLEDGAMSGKHRLGNWVLSATARTLFRVKLRDSQSGMWIIRRTVLATIPYENLSNGMAFSQEIKIEAFKRSNIAAEEIPSTLRPRIGEPVIESWRDGFGNLRALAKKRLRSRW